MIEPTKAVMRAAENIQEDDMLLELRSLELRSLALAIELSRIKVLQYRMIGKTETNENQPKRHMASHRRSDASRA